MKVGIEAAVHYHRLLLAPSVWPAGWQVLELNPAHVAEQRRVQGRRRVKTDALDLEAITELVLAGRGIPVTGREAVIGELGARAAHRTRRVQVRTATKNQLLGQLDRAFLGLTLALPDVLGTKVGRLVAAEFTDPARLAALDAGRFIGFAAVRGLTVRRPLAERLVAAARDALTTVDAPVARHVLAADLALLSELTAQIDTAEAELARLLPMSPFAALTTTPGWGVVRAGNYAGALGDPHRWPGPAQIYRASGLSPAQLPVPTSAAVLRMAAWRAGRSGINGTLLHPLTNHPEPAGRVIFALLDHVRTALAADGDLHSIQAGLERIRERGTGERRQRAVFERTGHLARVAVDAARITTWPRFGPGPY